MGDAYAGNRFNYIRLSSASGATAAVCGKGGFIHTFTLIPLSSGGAASTLFDGDATLIVTPAFAGGNETKPYTLTLDIASESTEGFNITCGASVAILISGHFPNA
jgi:hypothetical protein